jgi:hypothetical protein
VALALLWGALLAPAGCSSSPAAAACDSSKCAAGNACIDDGSGAGATCHKTCTTQAGCPAGYACHQAVSQGTLASWCVADWHVTCRPQDGEQDNPACDTAKGFGCYGTSPTDASSFCTRFQCATDADCLAGWWCATVNEAPNVTTATATLGQVRSVCLPRTYCSPCASDADCNPTPDGTPQQCVGDAQGNPFCATVCEKNVDCPFDATCLVQATICAPAQGQACRVDADCPPAGGVYQHCDGGHCTPECAGDGDCASGSGDAAAAAAAQHCVTRGLCAPRAGTCKGDGGFCSPCRSDADCTTGYCVYAGNSTERFCSAKATGGTCNPNLTNPPGCPPRKASDNWIGTACTSSPPDQCIGLVTFGTSAGSPQPVPGCWTANR